MYSSSADPAHWLHVKHETHVKKKKKKKSNTDFTKPAYSTCNSDKSPNSYTVL